MSSPIHHDKDVDAGLVYAPPWARETRRAPSAPPVAPAPEPPNARVPRAGPPPFAGDRAMLELQRRLALDPQIVPRPPDEPERTVWPYALRFGAAACFAALVAWGMVSMLATPRATHEPANEPARADREPMMAAKRVKLVYVRSASDAPVRQQVQVPPPTEQAPVRQEALAATPVERPQTDPPAPTAQPPDQVPRADTAVAVDREEIAALIKRGKALFAGGDVAAARLLLRHAAEAGSAEAMVVLGATFDPMMIRQIGAVGVVPDVEQARGWYQKAAALGSELATQQLAKLAQVP